jgi:hypothetical protein
MNVNPEDRIEIQKLGGLAGIGLPGSRIRSQVELRGSDLSPEERSSIEKLFEPKAADGGGPPAADPFRFQITLNSGRSRHEIVVGQADLLESLQARVHDELI